ncbi:preprotein translocase subunit YajC [Thiohalophilus sp.]|uniref:preprotein translocase subunit YajC n=1 Tax=Thiohalophilus sp. TaxID=3028392 RepID=UPI002ACE82FE|nr:preprotein translocase subunit YajC [Thiohalophilus sp.]MDZ7663403.1 preprotein translocase subunit YajC [Thiohalophilus sp.]
MSFFISDAMAQAAPAAQEPNIMSQLIFFVGIFVIFYFLLIRPQQKRAKEHRNLVSALSRGDEVVTNGGLAGKVTEVGDEYVNLELADNIEVKLQKQSVVNVLPKGTLKTINKE